jgi:hypothetical protein
MKLTDGLMVVIGGGMLLLCGYAILMVLVALGDLFLN